MQFPCTHCGQVLEIPDDSAGAQVTCPKCSNPTTVPSSSNTTTGVEIKTCFFPLAFLLFFCTPRIVIDGQVTKRSWGTSFFNLTPGFHTIEIYFGYVFMSRCGYNSVQIELTEGEILGLRYWMPPWMFAKGSIETIAPSGNITSSQTGETISNSSAATWSLILGILTCCCCGPVSAIPAIICGHIALSNIKKSNGKLVGRGMALTGLILGYIGITIVIILAATSFLQAQKVAKLDKCANNLRMIDSAKNQWALQNSKATAAEVDVQQVNEFINHGSPNCPKGGHYNYNPIDKEPACSIHGALTTAINRGH